jgi:hypothetical protein
LRWRCDFAVGPKRSLGLCCPLTTLAHHHVMSNRDDMTGVIEGLQRDHVLLAAFLEATDKIDWRALQRRVAIAPAPKPASADSFGRIRDFPPAEIDS